MINARLKDLRKKLGLSQTEFGKKLGVTRSVILNIELNKVAPKDIFIEHTCEVFCVNKEWLLDGVGEIFGAESAPRKTLDELWNLFKELNPEFQDYVLQQIDKLLEIQTKTDV